MLLSSESNDPQRGNNIPSSDTSTTNKGQTRFTRRRIFLFVVVLVILAIMLPLIPKSVIINENFEFFLIYETDDNPTYRRFEVPSGNSSNIQIIINGDQYSNAVDISFETTDWILNIHFVESNEIRHIATVTYSPDPPQPTFQRDEARFTCMLTKLSFNCTDKATAISYTATRTLIAQTTLGLVEQKEYLAFVEDQRLPLFSGISFSELGSLSELTVFHTAINATEKNYTFDPEEEYYVQEVTSKFTYKLNYPYIKYEYISLLASEFTAVVSGFIAAIAATVVAIIISFFKSQPENSK